MKKHIPLIILFILISCIGELTAQTLPTTPLLISPENGATVSLTPILSWSNSLNTKFYEVVISHDSLFKNIIIDSIKLILNQFRIYETLLSYDSTYYWKVLAYNSMGTSDWSETFRFNTISHIPFVPVLISPDNGSVNVSLTPTFDWRDVINADTYNLQISRTSDFSSLLFQQNNISVSQFTLPAGVLFRDSSYYWRVSGTNFLATGPPSSPWNFYTITTLPEVPVLNTPLNNSVNISLTPTLDWANVFGATTYVLKISSDSNFTNIILSKSDITSSQYSIPPTIFLYSTKYYWKVAALNIKGQSDYSDVWNFTTTGVPASPVLSSPANGATDISIIPTLDWDNIVGATSYRIQISTDSNFAGIILDRSNISLTQFYVIGPLMTYSTKYYWRVNASNAVGTGQWSIIWNLTTIPIPIPYAPVLYLPANNSAGISLTPMLVWHNNYKAERFRLTISTDLNFKNIIFDADTILAVQLRILEKILTLNTVYHWRVNAINSSGISPWSSVFNFTTFTFPTTPVLISPLNGATGVQLNPLLDWNTIPGVASYHLQVSNDSNFKNLTIDQNNLNNSQFNIPASVFSYSTKYFWKVNATNSLGTSPWSDVWSFTTRPIPVPEAPVLIYPGLNLAGVPLTPLMQWSSVVNAEKYRVNISTDSNFNVLVFDVDTVYTNELRVSEDVLRNNTLYYWRINAANSSGFGPWSLKRKFSTLVVNVPLADLTIPKEFSLHSNYPNPFNPNTKIRFDLPAASSVKLKVFDFLGRELKVLVDENLQPGSYVYDYNASELSSGIYFYKFETEKFISTKRMVLLK